MRGQQSHDCPPSTSHQIQIPSVQRISFFSYLISLTLHQRSLHMKVNASHKHRYKYILHKSLAYQENAQYNLMDRSERDDLVGETYERSACSSSQRCMNFACLEAIACISAHHFLAWIWYIIFTRMRCSVVHYSPLYLAFASMPLMSGCEGKMGGVLCRGVQVGDG